MSRSGCRQSSPSIIIFRRDWPSASVCRKARKAPVANQSGTHSRGQQYRPDSKRHESGSGYSGEYSDSVTPYSYLRRPLHKGPFRLESGKFVSMTRFYSGNIGSSVLLVDILGNFQNTAAFILWGQIFEHHTGWELQLPFGCYSSLPPAHNMSDFCSVP